VGGEYDLLKTFCANDHVFTGTLDFIGVNHYTSNYVYPTAGGSPGLDGDSNTGGEIDPAWEETAAPWLKVRVDNFQELKYNILRLIIIA
jgi:hypothetical protein